MAALREIFASFGIEFDREGRLAKGAVQTQRLTQGLQRLGVMLGAGIVARGVARFVGDTIRVGDELDKTARQLGLTTRELQAFRHAAELGGVDGAAFANSLGQLQNKAFMASNGSAEAARAFRTLGVEFRDANGQLLPGAQLLRNVADGLQRTDNSSLRTALAMQLMGESGRRLLPMLTDGSAGLNRMTAELDALGGGASQDFVERSVEVTDTLTRWRLALTSIKTTFLLQFLPGLNAALGAMARWMGRTSRSETAMRGLTIAFGLVAAAATAAALRTAIAWLAAGWPILVVVAFVGLLALAVEDLWVTWNGGQSTLRTLINEIWPGMVDGLDSTDRAIRAVTDGVAWMITAFENLGATVPAIIDIMLSALRPLTVAIGVVQDLMAGMGLGRVASRAAGRLTRSDVFGGSLIGESPEAAAQDRRRSGAERGINALGRRVAGGEATYSERSLRDRLAPARLRRGTGITGEQTIDNRVEITQTINTQSTDPAEVARLVQRGTREELQRHMRQAQAALVPSTPEYGWEE